MSDDQLFSVYLGNIPADVILEEVWINREQLMMSESAQRGYSISPVVNLNGSRAYNLQLPFEDTIVHWMVRVPHRTCITSFDRFGSGGCVCGTFLCYDGTSHLPDQSGSTALTQQLKVPELGFSIPS